MIPALIVLVLLTGALYAARPIGPTLYDRCRPFDLLARLAMAVKAPEVAMLRGMLDSERKVNAALMDRLTKVEEAAGIPTTREKLSAIGIER